MKTAPISIVMFSNVLLIQQKEFSVLTLESSSMTEIRFVFLEKMEISQIQFNALMLILIFKWIIVNLPQNVLMQIAEQLLFRK